MPNTARLLFHATVGIGLSAIALASACSSNEPDASPVTGQQTPGGGTSSTTPNQNDNTPTQSALTNGQQCEELGRLVGTSLAGTFISSTARAVKLPLANRPVPSQIGIVALGTSADLLGKTAALGAGDDANYQTCTHCFVIALNCGTDCTNAAWFFPRSGNATFTAVPSAAGEPFSGTFTDVVLEEVKIDFSSDVSTVLPGGTCLHVQELTFDATVTSADGGKTSSSSSSGGSTSSSGGTSGDGGTGTGTDSGTGADSGGSSTSSSGGTGSSGGSGHGGGGGDGTAAKATVSF